MEHTTDMRSRARRLVTAVVLLVVALGLISASAAEASAPAPTAAELSGDLTAADVTGDGYADLLGVHADGSLWLWVNTRVSSKPYVSSIKIGTGFELSSWRISAADLNHDGRADLVGQRRDDTVWAWINTGSVTHPFATRTQVGFGFKWPWLNVSAADVTGDGLADLLAVQGDGTVWAWFNTGNPSHPFAARTQVGSGFVHSSLHVFWGDVTGDGYTDLLAVHRVGSVWMWTNTKVAGHPFGGRVEIGTGFHWSSLRVFAADVTGDGFGDLLALRTDGTLWMWTNSGNASHPFGPRTEIATGFGWAGGAA